LDSDREKVDSANQNEVLGSLSGSAIRQKMRVELLNWFRRNAESLAGAYDGATRLLEFRKFPGRVQFIAHSVRDISNILVSVLDPQSKGSRVEYKNELDRIGELWPGIQVVKDTSNLTAAPDTMTISFRLASIIDSLVEAHRRSIRQPSNSEKLFRFLMRNEPSRGQVNQRLVSEFKKIRDWFMELTHFRDEKAPEVNEDELQAQFFSFEAMLHSFVGDFFTGAAELDEILRQANK
jgi:hypothetical protein